MTGFHTWRRRCEGVSQNSGYGYEESHLIHDMTIVSPRIPLVEILMTTNLGY